MSPDFEMLMRHLREQTADVELDMPAPLGSADPAAASELAKHRRVAINRGDRVAHVFNLVDGQRNRSGDGSPARPELQMLVTETEGRALIAAGAKWIGSPVEALEPRPYIDQLRVRNFRCVKDVTIALTPLHAFIGPNDSGKSTLLEAISTFSTGNPVLGCVTASYQHSALTEYILSNGQGGMVAHDLGVPIDEVLAGSRPNDPAILTTLRKIVVPIRFLRLDPDAMREPTNLIPQGATIEFDPRGKGLAGVYDALLSRRLDAFLAISRRFTTLFPTARAIQLTNPTNLTKALGVELVDKTSIDAPKLSEGMLYWLAFAALPYLDPAAVVLIEEPENGLHPARIAEVMRVLRDISSSTQIVIATHSPLVINELQADEVTVITRTPARGTIATPLSRTKNFEQRSRVYALGELWLNYADGNVESELVAESTVTGV
jgi:predicted ATPase